jgi:predicted PP-loop superfamily ATPase
MLQNFGQLKQQLSELATVLNEFKSEAVQLRLLELVFDMDPMTEPVENNKPAIRRRPAAKKTKTFKRADEPAATSAKKSRGGSGSGAVATLSQLVAVDFFKKPQTINDIIEHCKHNLARTFKANEFSGKLGRLVRSEELSRKKNADGQYEYTGK